MSEHAIQLFDLSKKFGQLCAVHSIDLTIRRGEFFALLGPSGCGKTTLLRMIAGFEEPSSGRIFIDGVDVAGIPAYRRTVNMVFQNYALFPHLTVNQNVGFGLRTQRKMKSSEISSRVEQALNMVRLKEFGNRYPEELSGGQQQRVALARGIVNEPAVLLLDEPLSALDPQIRNEMQAEIGRLQKELRMTFIMVTHDQNEALALSDRVAVLRNGKIEQLGTPHELYNYPATKFVASFIGDTNIVSGRVVEHCSDMLSVQVNGCTVAIKRNEGQTIPSLGMDIFVCSKPESTELVQLTTTDSVKEAAVEYGMPNAKGETIKVKARIVSKNYQGHCTSYSLETEHGFALRASILNSDGKEHASFSNGQEVLVKLGDLSYFV